MAFERITGDPGTMGGQHCIRWLRIPVATVVAKIADGMTVAEILADLPGLEADDVVDALRSAAEAVREHELPPAPAGVRFLVDEILSPRVAEILGASGHDATLARDLGLEAASDAVVLQTAGRDGRVVVWAGNEFGAFLAPRLSQF